MTTMKPLTLAVVQFTPRFGEKGKNLSRMQELVTGIAADIMVFPELCTTGYFFVSREEAAEVAETGSGQSSQFFREMAQQKNAVVIAGFAERHRKKIYNACLIVIPESRGLYVYRKTHLFYKEKNCFDPGNTGFFVVKDKQRDIAIGPMICYDWRFPESARVLTLMGADLIVCPSNLITDAWRRVMPARAIENNVYLAVANRVGMEKRKGEVLRFKGNSAIYDYSGRQLKKAGKKRDEVLLAEIYPAMTRDKSFNPINDVLADRQPQHYSALTKIVK